jgi:hypothetical protein
MATALGVDGAEWGGVGGDYSQETNNQLSWVRLARGKGTAGVDADSEWAAVKS